MKRSCVLLVAGLAALASPACSSSGESTSPGTTRPGTVTSAPEQARPPGPEALLTGPMTGGQGIVLPAPSGTVSLRGAGYLEAEYTAAGRATSYRSAGELPADGSFALEPDAAADYRTRIVVRRPADPRAANGAVVLEWLNVSGGADSAPDFTYLGPELLRQGYVWVGVSAQLVGVEGGPVAVSIPGLSEAAGAGKGLRGIDPARYGNLHHPGDAFSYDIVTQVARALRSPAGGPALDNLPVRRILAVGESQSAFMLTTYYDGVQPLTRAFDGFLIHSRGGAAAPLGTSGGAIDIATTAGGPPKRLRTDQTAPALVVETETDLLGLLRYLPARQPDHDRLRVWEVAGTAHADHTVIGATEAAMGCPQPINRGQQWVVLRAALHHLDEWIVAATRPPAGVPLDVDPVGGSPKFVTDAAGNVKAGVRTPAVDAPVDRLSGLPAESGSGVCILSGTTTPLSAEQLRSLYISRADYLARYARATDAAIDAGFVLRDDRDELITQAQPSRIEG